jgi:hypothetical protein
MTMRLAIALLLATSCQHGAGPMPDLARAPASAQSSKGEPAVAPADVPAPAVMGPIDDRSVGPMADEYTGTIGEKAPIVMRLHTTARGLAGEYFYEAVGEALSLSGTVVGARHVSLTEKARSGQVTGTFSGDRLPSGGVAGTWEAPGGARRLPFTLAPIPRASGPGPVRVFRRAFRNQGGVTGPLPDWRAPETPSTCDIKVEYAEVFGLESAAVEAKINKVLSAEDERACTEPCEGGVGYEVTFNRGGVLSVDVSGEHTCWLAAHPSNYEGFSANFLLSTGEQLTLEQVFKKPFEVHAAKTFAAVVDSMMTKIQSGEGEPSADDALYRDQLTHAFESPEFVFVEGGVRFWIARRLPHAFQGLAAYPSTLTFGQLAGVLDPTSRVAFLWQR